MAAIVSEIGRVDTTDVKTLFIGGGTPSLLTPDHLNAIVSGIKGKTIEATIEVNPETIFNDPGLYSQLGFTRVSVGVQSLQRDELERLGRHHDAKEALSAIERISDCGIEYSLDFIYGLPGSFSTIDDLELVFGRFRPPRHLSIYGLTIESGTRLYFRGEDHPVDDEVANDYEAISSYVNDLGLSNYEISNFAEVGFESLHNLNYWYQGNYIGLGPSSHSFDGVNRSWNVFDSLRWLERVEGGGVSVAGSERLNSDQLAFEAAMLSLRTAVGVPEECVGDADFLSSQDLISVMDGWVILTSKGRLVHSALANDLVINDPLGLRERISSRFRQKYPQLGA